MTKTIKEITEKLQEVCLAYGKDEYYNFTTIVNSEKRDDGSNNISVKINRTFKDSKHRDEFLGKLEEAVFSFADNSDNLATAFAAFITFVITENLGNENETYQQILARSADKIVPSDLEDRENLKLFLEDFSAAVCNNDYTKIEELHHDYCYSITSLYLFCYKMFLYYDCYIKNGIWNKEIFSELKTLYSKMAKNSHGNDMSNYALGMGDYKIIYSIADSGIYGEDRFLPYCSFFSPKGTDAVVAAYNWKKLFHILNIGTERVTVLEFYQKLHAFLSNQDDVKKDYFNLETIFQNMTAQISNVLPSGADSFYPWFSHKIKREKDCDTQQEIIDNNLALHIPAFIPTHGDFSDINKLLNYNIILDSKNDELKQAQEEKKEIIDDFSHRYKNMKATSLHNVANSLLEMESETLKQYGRTILLEYGIKESLRKEVDILKLYFEDNIGELKKRIQDSIFPKSSKECHSIYDIIDNSIKKCMITLVYDGDDDPLAIRAICFKDYDLISISNSFEKDILFKENVDVIKWFSENIAKLDVGISDYWKQIFCKKYSHSDNIISDLLVELIMNDFKYADKKQPITIELTEDDNFIIIKSENTPVKDKTNIPSYKNGIKTQNKLLNVLNRTEHKVDDSIIYGEKDGKFSIEIKLSKKMFEIKKDEEDDEYADMV